MSSETTAGLIHIEMTLPTTPDAAFSRFTDDMFAWWPHEYTWAGVDLAAMYVQPKPGGHCIERDAKGNELVWGTVLESDPPRRLVFTWQIGPDRAPIANPEDASEIEVHFEARGPSETTFSFEHRHFDRHGDDGEIYRAALATEHGWPVILQRYAESFG